MTVNWDDDRNIDLLKEKWAEGLSCAQIAKEIPGATRSAIIGKVHRLGLAGRANPSRPTTTRKPVEPRRPAAPRPPPAPKPPPPDTVEKAAPVEELAGTATVFELASHMCKWPIGEPGDDSFRYCGRRRGEGPYCEHHTRLAYKPVPADRPRSGNELARSLRRYF